MKLWVKKNLILFFVDGCLFHTKTKTYLWDVLTVYGLQKHHFALVSNDIFPIGDRGVNFINLRFFHQVYAKKFPCLRSASSVSGMEEKVRANLLYWVAPKFERIARPTMNLIIAKRPVYLMENGIMMKLSARLVSFILIMTSRRLICLMCKM